MADKLEKQLSFKLGKQVEQKTEELDKKEKNKLKKLRVTIDKHIKKMAMQELTSSKAFQRLPSYHSPIKNGQKDKADGLFSKIDRFNEL